MEIGVREKDLGELERLLGLFEAGKLSGPLTVARLLLVSRDVASIERWLAGRVATGSGGRHALLHLIEQHRHGCQCVAALREGHVAEGGRVLGAVPAVAGRDAGALDRVELEQRGTQEIVERFDAWGLLGPERKTLELGCGAGRLQAALWPRVALAAGVDSSTDLIARARWCLARLPNTRHEVGSGADLSSFDDASLQLVYAVDSLPALASSDGRVTSTFAEVSRVLAPAGDFVILESSSRDEGPADAGDVERLARGHGLEVVASGERPFRFRDGVTYRLRRAS
jgi:hypothetical protein